MNENHQKKYFYPSSSIDCVSIEAAKKDQKCQLIIHVHQNMSLSLVLGMNIQKICCIYDEVNKQI